MQAAKISKIGIVGWDAARDDGMYSFREDVEDNEIPCGVISDDDDDDFSVMSISESSDDYDSDTITKKSIMYKRINPNGCKRRIFQNVLTIENDFLSE